MLYYFRLFVLKTEIFGIGSQDLNKIKKIPDTILYTLVIRKREQNFNIKYSTLQLLELVKFSSFSKTMKLFLTFDSSFAVLH